MKKWIFVVALASAWTVGAQVPGPQQAAKAEPAKAAPAKKAKTAGMTKKSRRAEDARHCLQRGDNNAIIKCAEEYL